MGAAYEAMTHGWLLHKYKNK